MRSNNFRLQDVDNKIEKPNLGSKPPEVNKMRLEYDRKLKEDKKKRDEANEKLDGNVGERKGKISEKIENVEGIRIVQESGLDMGSSNNGTIIKEEIRDGKANRKEELINNEAIRKEEKEAQNEIAANTPKAATSEIKNHEMEILEKLKKQEEEQKKIMQQQEAILKEVIKQNKQLEEIKAKDEAKDDAQLKASVVSSLDPKVNSGKLEANLGSGLVTHVNPGKSVSNNLISEKIQELNENIKELNRDEIKLTNQIDKVEESILREDQVGNKPNENMDIGNNNMANKQPLDTVVNQKVGIRNAEKRDDGISVGIADKFDKPIVGQMVFNKAGEIGGNLNVNRIPSPNNINSVGNINNDVPIALDRRVDDKPGTLNGDINNIESPPNEVSKVPLGNSNANVLNEAFIEVEKDLNYKKNAAEKSIDKKKTNEKKSAVNPVPIALMLQPSTKPDPKPVDIIKTRDILANVRREKRDVRQEPANPEPPEYELVEPTVDPLQALKESVDKEIEKLDETDRKLSEDNPLGALKVVKRAVVQPELNKNEDLTKIDEPLESVKKPVNISVNTNEASVKDPAVSSDDDSLRKGSVLDHLDLNETTVNSGNKLKSKEEIRKSKNFIHKTSDVLDFSENDTRTRDKSINDRNSISIETLPRHDILSNPPSVQTISYTNDIVNKIPSDLNIVFNSSKIINSSIDKTVPNKISNEEILQSVDQVDRTNKNNTANVIQNINEDQKLSDESILNNIDKFGKISDTKIVLNNNDNQNEKCDAKSSEDIRAPQILSNLNHADLLRSLQLDKRLKDQVMNNIAADKVIKR